MYWRAPGSAKYKNRTRTIFFQCTALITILFALLLLNACSGFSKPTANATANPTAPTTTSTASLTISSTLPSATVGSNYSATLNVTGGTAPYSFSLKSGALPAGLLLGSTTGIISGTPTATGSFSFALLVSDSKEISKQQSLQITVASAPVTTPPVTTTPGKTFPNLQQSGGWTGYGLTPPSYATCSPSSCDGIIYSMSQGINSPSMSGNSTQYSLSGTTVYADALFNNHLIGDFSSQGLPDNNHTLVPTYHNFTYDVYFYGTNLEISQALEFDINQFFDDQGFIWGHECRIAGGHEWDIWDNINQHWVPTGIACNPNSNSWNHLTIQVQRTADNQLLFQSITLNGVTGTVNQYYNPGTTDGWYGITVNYQMDGNYQQSPYSIYLDDLTFTYQ
jgi:Putative Ig domain